VLRQIDWYQSHTHICKKHTQITTKQIIYTAHSHQVSQPSITPNMLNTHIHYPKRTNTQLNTPDRPLTNVTYNFTLRCIQIHTCESDLRPQISDTLSYKFHTVMQ
jgi:hypothetical protein